MSKPKPVNWELLQKNKVHNPPEFFYYDGSESNSMRIVYADGLLEPPRVITHKVLRGETFDKVKEWLDENKISYKPPKKDEWEIKKIPKKDMGEKQLQWFEKNKVPYKNGNYIIKTRVSEPNSELMDWVKIIHPLVNLFDLSEKESKDLFSKYRDSMIVKLSETIGALDRAINEIWNERIRLFPEKQVLTASKERYEKALNEFKDKHKRTGKYKFLYNLLVPLRNKLKNNGFSDYRIEKAIYRLFKIFGHDEDFLSDVIMRELKKQI